MKGVVFTEFMEMVENKFSSEMADDIVAAANLPHGGAYTAVGTYPHAEMGRLVIELSKRTDIKVPDLLRAYGRHLFARFREGYGEFFANVSDSFGFLSKIDDVVHVEVRKLYPDAELPEFDAVQVSPQHLRMTYRSPRCLGDFAEGLMEGCIAHYGEKVSITRANEDEGRVVRFDLVKEVSP